MTKAELARIAASTHGVDAATGLKIINSFLGLIVATTSSGMPVQLHGFGTFTLGKGNLQKRGRKAREPAFRPSKAYRSKVR